MAGGVREEHRRQRRPHEREHHVVAVVVVVGEHGVKAVPFARQSAFRLVDDKVAEAWVVTRSVATGS